MKRVLIFLLILLLCGCGKKEEVIPSADSGGNTSQDITTTTEHKQEGSGYHTFGTEVAGAPEVPVEELISSCPATGFTKDYEYACDENVIKLSLDGNIHVKTSDGREGTCIDGVCDGNLDYFTDGVYWDYGIGLKDVDWLEFEFLDKYCSIWVEGREFLHSISIPVVAKVYVDRYTVKVDLEEKQSIDISMRNGLMLGNEEAETWVNVSATGTVEMKFTGNNYTLYNSDDMELWNSMFETDTIKHDNQSVTTEEVTAGTTKIVNEYDLSPNVLAVEYAGNWSNDRNYLQFVCYDEAITLPSNLIVDEWYTSDNRYNQDDRYLWHFGQDRVTKNIVLYEKVTD